MLVFVITWFQEARGLFHWPRAAKSYLESWFWMGNPSGPRAGGDSGEHYWPSVRLPVYNRAQEHSEETYCWKSNDGHMIHPHWMGHMIHPLGILQKPSSLCTATSRSLWVLHSLRRLVFFLWALWMAAFRWRGSYSIIGFTIWMVLFYFTQIYINGSFGAPNMYCDRIFSGSWNIQSGFLWSLHCNDNLFMESLDRKSVV